MPRPFKCRRISSQPGVAAFKPAGVPGRDLETATLGLDEMEALRLADLEGLYHEAAALRMSISRATFGRLLEGARRKIVSALFEGKMLVFEGGPVIMAEMRTFSCGRCGNSFQEPFGTARPAACPHCGSRKFYRIAAEGEARGRHGARHGAARQGSGGGQGGCCGHGHGARAGKRYGATGGPDAADTPTAASEQMKPSNQSEQEEAR